MGFQFSLQKIAFPYVFIFPSFPLIKIFMFYFAFCSFCWCLCEIRLCHLWLFYYTCNTFSVAFYRWFLFLWVGCRSMCKICQWNQCSGTLQLSSNTLYSISVFTFVIYNFHVLFFFILHFTFHFFIYMLHFRFSFTFYISGFYLYFTFLFSVFHLHFSFSVFHFTFPFFR